MGGTNVNTKKIGDFVNAPTPQRNALCIVFGPTGQGKTTWAASSIWPGRKGAVIDTERRALWVIQKREQEIGESILYHPLKLLRKAGDKTDQQVMAEARTVCDSFMKNYEAALESSLRPDGIRTIIIDTASEYYKSALFFKIFGRTDKIIQRDHGVPRAEFRAMTRMAREYPVNLILLCHEKEEYLNNQATGVMTWAGFEEMGADVDFAVRVTIDRPKRPKEGEPTILYKSEFTKFLEAESVVSYTQEDYDPFGPFVYACMQQFVGTTPEDWGWEEQEA